MNNDSQRFVIYFPLLKKRVRLRDAEDYNDILGPRAIIAYLIVYLCVVAAIGFVANIAVIVKTVLFQRHLSRQSRDLTMTSTNYFVLSLSFGNIGTLTISVLFYFWIYYCMLPINEVVCRYILPMQQLFIAVSIFSITLIGVDRFLILFKGFREKMVALSYKVWVAMLWILCYLIFSLPFSFVYQVVRIDGAIVCDSRWSSKIGRRIHITFLIIFMVLLPGIIVFVSYSGIVRSLKRVRSFSERTVGGDLNRSAALIMTKSKRIVTVSLMMVISFWVTFTPYALLVLFLEFGDLTDSDFKQLHVLHAIAASLLYSSAMVFPLILLFSIHSRRLKRVLPLHISKTI